MQETYIDDIDWEDSGHPAEPDEGIVLPEISIPLSSEQLDFLKATINPLQHSENHGIDLYLQTVYLVERMLHDEGGH